MSSNYPDYDPNLVSEFFRTYHDRGMMKWQGFYLSDHTKKLEQELQEDTINNLRKRTPEMTTEEIAENIEMAITKSKTVSVQINETDTDRSVPPEIIGKINGQHEQAIIIGQSTIIPLEQIRSLEIIEDKY